MLSVLFSSELLWRSFESLNIFIDVSLHLPRHPTMSVFVGNCIRRLSAPTSAPDVCLHLHWHPTISLFVGICIDICLHLHWDLSASISASDGVCICRQLHRHLSASTSAFVCIYIGIRRCLYRQMHRHLIAPTSAFVSMHIGIWRCSVCICAICWHPHRNFSASTSASLGISIGIEDKLQFPRGRLQLQRFRFIKWVIVWLGNAHETIRMNFEHWTVNIVIII